MLLTKCGNQLLTKQKNKGAVTPLLPDYRLFSLSANISIDNANICIIILLSIVSLPPCLPIYSILCVHGDEACLIYS